MIVGIHHVAIGVSDIEKALTFYTEGLVFEVVQRSHVKNSPKAVKAMGIAAIDAKMAMLKTSNAFIELRQYSHPAYKDLRSGPCDYGYPHLALQVGDIQDEYDRLKTHGMEFVGEVVHFEDRTSAIYGRAPCGNIIELYEIKAKDIAQLKRE